MCKRHGWQLTELEPLKGRSAFRGAQRELGPLAEFLKRVEGGKIKAGSVLIVESLDRLTREKVKTALKFIISILDAGVSIATTNPEYLFKHDGENDLQDIMLAVVILSRGHEESALKSERVGKAWADKRATAKTKKLTAICPAWLQMREDRSGFDEIEKNADTVRLIFTLAADGYGVFRICRKLNRGKVPTFGNKPNRKARQWYESYVIRILNNRAAVGEYQPCTRDGNKSIPAGDPVKGYYPAVVTMAQFTAARKALASRALGFKRTGKDVPNIFGKLIKNARDGLGWLYVPAKKKSPHARLEPVGGRGGASAPLSYRYADLEAGFLASLREVSAADLTDKPQVSRAGEIEAQVSDLKDRIGVLEGKMKTDKNLGALLDTLSAWKDELAQLEKALEAEKTPTDAGAILSDAKGVIELLATDPMHYRTKLKQLLHLLISEMWLMVFEYETQGSRGRTMTARAAILQVHLRDGHVCSYHFSKNRDGTLVALRFDPPRLYQDLRQPADAAELVRTTSRVLVGTDQLDADIKKYGRPQPEMRDRERNRPAQNRRC